MRFSWSWKVRTAHSLLLITYETAPDKLAFSAKPIITKFPQSPIYIVPGQTLEIQCDADGYPFPNVYWEKVRYGNFSLGSSFSQFLLINF